MEWLKQPLVFVYYARLYEAPKVFDCSSFTKWIYGQRGIWLPRRSIQQSEIGEPVEVNELTTGDLVFTSGAIDYYRENPDWGVGHVGLYVGNGNVVHAANKKSNILETNIYDFIKGGKLRAVRRYISKGAELLTVELPASREVEISDDIRWIVLQSFS